MSVKVIASQRWITSETRCMISACLRPPVSKCFSNLDIVFILLINTCIVVAIGRSGLSATLDSPMHYHVTHNSLSLYSMCMWIRNSDSSVPGTFDKRVARSVIWWSHHTTVPAPSCAVATYV